ncbi:hydroxymethylglutaryl-CoA synthase [Pontiella sulfatireligans]|uniref:Hydroxymethylglutaryl-CoA synthase n=1 Tax=Pontiella sulfatireligans TaxID=2750658 RepID=A0A6C2UFZ3_9BACT|nr:hydroxymethylglutaryl-CoA synthase [Pontiella sulfatireligans]VGO19038.1 Hydroxymethylglutaryl-CoA synthase [Pontiella sulfatireligans]
MNIGIDRISFHTSHYYVDLKTLAEVRSVEVNKYYVGIGQEKMGIPSPDEDVVTLAASAAYPLMQAGELDEVELLLFATESGIDQSKSAGVYVHGLLEMPARCRTVELKQACYSGTAGLQLAIAFVARNPGKKALVIASDIARYELGSPGEATQGCGSVAMLVSANPRLLAIEPESGYVTEDVMDFWRPNYRSEAFVDGKYSTMVYIHTLVESWKQYAELTGRLLSDFDRFCYHIPFTKMAEKAHQKLCRKFKVEADNATMYTLLDESLRYSRVTGNCYSGSMYVGLASLLETAAEDLSGKRVGFYSYGSGCVGEFFSGVVQPGYGDFLFADQHRNLLENRTELTYQQYEDIFNYGVPTDGGEYVFPQYKTGPFRFSGISQHKREYESLVD